MKGGQDMKFLNSIFVFAFLLVAVVFFFCPAVGAEQIAKLAMDGSGGVYVIGYSDSGARDIGTIKYDPDGHRVWADGRVWRRCALATDAPGNVYVTGTIAPSSLPDYVTYKFAPDGDQLWAASYDGPATGSDSPTSLTADAAGNVYVTGSSEGDGTSADFATIKYAPDGSELWVARYNGPRNSLDSAHALAVDASGNIYVTGESYRAVGEDTFYDCATIKYAPDGSELWLAYYNGPTNSSDHGNAVAVDASGYVYVTGRSADPSWYDYATIKYAPDGTELWVARYAGPGNYIDEAVALAVDADGNVYVTGFSEGAGTGPDYATIKYAPDGTELWVARYNGPGNLGDGGASLAVDTDGNVYVTGFSEGTGTASDYATIKYAPDGTELWVARYNSPGNGADAGAALALDATANVYVTGHASGSITTIKYDSDGNRIWVDRYQRPADPAPRYFRPPVDYGAGQKPNAVDIGDLNGDDHLDLAVANYSTDSVSVLLGNGDGTFQAAVNYGAHVGPWSVDVGDLDGDTAADLAVANRDSGDVSVLLGNGDGTFRDPANYQAGSSPRSVALGDLNGDGALDLAVADAGSGDVSVLLGNGDGTFQEAVGYGAGAMPNSVAVGDLDGDGNLDLAVANGEPGTGLSAELSVLLGRGDGTFLPRVAYPWGFSIAIGDLNGDNKLDLVGSFFYHHIFQFSQMLVMLGKGDGTFSSPYTLDIAGDPISVTIGDLVGDGAADVAAVLCATDSIALLSGNGDGSFSFGFPSRTLTGLGRLPVSVAAGDLNGDGNLDLAVANRESSDVSVLISTLSPPAWGVPGSVMGTQNGSGADSLSCILSVLIPLGVLLCWKRRSRKR
jgi:uncharacterized delta-60 repeat protein